MSRFEQILTPTDDSQLAELYQSLRANGFGSGNAPVNWFTAQATRPDILAATWSFTESILVKGQLPATVKQMIAVTISAQNNCRYCSVLHTNVLEKLGVATEVIQSCVSDPTTALIPPPHQAILNFALKAAREPKAITLEDYDELRDNGLSDEEIIEVIALAAFTNFINTWANVSGIELDKGGA